MVSHKRQVAQASVGKLGAPPCPQRDLYHRVHYAYQTSLFLQHLDIEVGKECKLSTLSDLSRRGMKSTRRMAVHNQLKLYVSKTWSAELRQF